MKTEYEQFISNNDDSIISAIYTYNITKYDFQNIIANIYDKKYNFKNSLDNLHLLIDNKYLSDENIEYFNQLSIFGINDRKCQFIRDFYEHVTIDESFIKKYKEFIIEYIKPNYPDEKYLIYQQTPNLRISLPNLSAIGKRLNDPNEDIIGLHCDNEFGHSIHEMNYILPITEMFESNSIYYEKTIYSNDSYDNYYNLMLKENQFFVGYFNKLRHYNKINKTEKTRISIDFRIIPYSKYIDDINDKTSISFGKKLKLGEYFDIL